MKVRIGNRAGGFNVVSADTKADLARVEEQVRVAIMRQVQQKSRIAVGPTQYAQLQKLIETLAGREVLRIFPLAVRIIKRSRTFNLSDLHNYRYGLGRTAFGTGDMGSLSMPGGKSFLGSVPKWGQVNWMDLSPNWIEYKYGTNPPGNRFFIHTGRLTNYLSGRGGDPKEFGGVETDVTSRATGAARRSTKSVLATLRVNIFPGISPNLMPMLSSNRWSDAGDGSFERRFFPDRTAEKLIGPEGFHRPLFVPIVQFWTAFHIPRAVTVAINRWLRSL